MQYRFKKYRIGKYLSVSFTDYMAPSWRVYDLDDHKAIAFMDRWPDAVELARLVFRSGAIIL